MCFSATASFTSSAVIAVGGIATVSISRHPRQWLFAAIPLFFAWHQFAEGMVWLGLDGTDPIGDLRGWGFAYMLYAQGLLPLLIPLGVLLIEPNATRRWLIAPFVVLGLVLTGYQLWALLNFDTAIFVKDHSVVYHNPATAHLAVVIPYVVATCGSLFFSGYRYVMAVGVVNLIGVLLVMFIKSFAFTSVWCAYAAVVSLLIFGHYYRERAAERRGQTLTH